MTRFELNVAINGRHYCRVQLPETVEGAAVEKARVLEVTFQNTLTALGAVECSLTRWEDVGHGVAI